MKRKKIIHIIVCACAIRLLFLHVNAQTIVQPGYKQIDVIRVEGVTTEGAIYHLGVDQKTTTREYIDGLARPIQRVIKQGSPLQKDIVQPIVYDAHGQEVNRYLPYVSPTTDGSYQANALTAQSVYYANGSSDKVADDSKPYVKQELEQSPVQRLLQIGSVGEGFQPGQHVQEVNHRTNTAADQVRIWKPDGTTSASYAAGSLWVTEYTATNGDKTLVFEDKMGKRILQRVQADETVDGVSRPFFDTYYVYTEAGSVRYIIPPKAVAQMQTAGSWTLTAARLDELIFSYVYDDLGRVVEKKIPGSAAIYIVYDALDRPLLVQDGNLRATNKWYYTKYDSRQRTVSEGIYTNTTYTTRAAMQNYVHTLNFNTVYAEERQAGTTYGYSNQVFPTTGTEALAYYYYDDYDLNNDGTRDYAYVPQSLTDEAVPHYFVRGQLTAVKRKIIGGTTWLTSIIFFDKRGHLIQVRSNNQRYANVADSRTLVPDFEGKVLRQKTIKAISASSTTMVLSSFTYDAGGRISTIDDSYNGGANIRIAAYEYNELGQLVKRNLHGLGGAATVANIELDADDALNTGQTKTVTASQRITLKPGFFAAEGSQFSASIDATYLQSIDYRYNIRGMLTSINNSTLSVDDKNDDMNDLFGMELLYEQGDAGVGNTAYYTGQVSAIKWRSKTPSDNNPKERSYRYSYDKLNRLTDALYLERSTGGSWGNAGAYDEKNIQYDENGNILSLQRNAYISGSISTMDNLSYSYQGNRLNNLSDGGSPAQGHRNLTGSTAAYGYTAAGGLATDPKKGLSFTYNVLNRTDRVTVNTSAGRYIQFTYDASGTLLRKQAYDNNVVVKTTDYIDGFVYEDGVLAYFGMAEGRVRNTGTGLKPEYMVTDYQGNVRVSFEESAGQAVVRQDNSYYPYGFIMPGGTVPSQPNRNLYNGGSEWENGFGTLPDYYRTHFRNYEAAIARFTAVDPRAEADAALSPYHYGGNNPVWYNDPMGDIKVSLEQALSILYSSLYDPGSSGGTWESNGDGTGELTFFNNNQDALQFGASQMDSYGWWGLNGFARDYRLAERSYNRHRSSSDPLAQGQQRYITMATWYRGADGQATTVDGLSGDTRVMDLEGQGSNYKQAGFSDELGQVMNLGGVVWGSAELGIQALRQSNGAQTIGRFLGFGTQRTAMALRGTLGTVSKLGKQLGTAGMVLSAYSYFDQVLDPKKTVSTATHVNFWISAGFYGAAVFFGGPITAGAALIYGTAELGSWLYNGKTLEENIIGD